MTPAAPTPPATPDADRVRLVDACPQCGYSLTGSPEAGVCPECGTPYDQSMIVLHGVARGNLANLGNGEPRRQIGHGCVAVVVLAYVSHSIGSEWRNPFSIIVAAYIVLVTTLGLARRFLLDRPGLVQVYLHSDGFLQRDHDDRSLLYTLDRIVPRTFTIVLISLLLVTSHDAAGERLGMIGLGTSAAIIAGAIVYHFVAHRPGRPPAALEVFRLWRRSWREVDEMLLDPAGPSTFRLHLRKRVKGMLWSESVTYFADVEMACTPEQAGRLRTVVGGWIAAGRRAAAARQV